MTLLALGALGGRDDEIDEVDTADVERLECKFFSAERLRLILRFRLTRSSDPRVTREES